MASGNSETKVGFREDADGSKSVALSHVNTDAPLLPVKDLAELHNFRPELVDKVVEWTEIEGKHRRALALLSDERTYNTTRRAQWISFAITMTFLVVCLVMALKEAYAFALSMAGIGAACVSAITAIANLGKGEQTAKGSPTGKAK